MEKRIQESMVIAPVVQEEVEKIIKSLKDSSSGWDSISPKVVKCTYNSFLVPLTHIMHTSLVTGVFPTELKIARVIPIFKAGDTSSFTNYRPVSVLPLFSKILERLMYTRLLSFINKHNLLYKFQFGFRSQHSPNFALMILVDQISEALESGDYVLGLFLDFSKAFDTVNHEILLKKLEFYGIRGIALKWFRSYLHDRVQYVEYNETASSKGNITCGVPQGSILGPLLFLLYVNDLSKASTLVFSILFADDTNMFLTGKDPNILVKTMSQEMNHVVDWLKLNKLSLNLSKTHFIIFRRKGAKVCLTEDLTIDKVNINMVDSTKFLGVFMDQNLTFHKHIHYIKGKIARGIGILYKCRPILNENTLKMLYNAIIYPYFTYCVEVWGSTYSKYIDPLLKIQKRAIRTIVGAKKYDHTLPLYKKLHLLNVHQIYVYCVQLFMFKYKRSLLPSLFDELFLTNSSVHSHNTRQHDLLHVPIIRTEPFSRTVRMLGVYSYNYFSTRIEMGVSYETYKRHLKRHVLDSTDIYSMCGF